MNKLTVNQKYSFFLEAASLFGRSQRSRRKQGRWRVKQGERERKCFQGCEHGTVTGTKSVDLAVTSEIIRCSYITRLLNSFQGQQGDRLSKITALFTVSGYLTPTILGAKGPTPGMEWFFPREGRGQPDGGRERFYITRSHQSQT